MPVWVEENIAVFQRDILRDFCLASQELEEQFRRLANTGSLSFAALRGLVGDGLGKGPLWRLKDTSHHLLGNRPLPGMLEERPENLAAGPLLDWTISYVFHECVKMQEDAYQLQYYGPKLDALDLSSGQEEKKLLEDLLPIIEQSRNSLAREAERVDLLLEKARRLFCLYLKGQADNQALARFLHEEKALVAGIFRELYEPLLRAIYGGHLDELPLRAAAALLESGHMQKAEAALKEAQAQNCANPALKALQRLLNAEKNRRRRKV